MTTPIKRTPVTTTVDDDETLAEQLKGFFLRNIVMMIALVLAVVVVIVATNTSADRREVIKRQEADILALSQERDGLSGSLDGKLEQVMRDATGGMDLDHKRADDAVVSEFLDIALSWEGVQAYIDAREQIMRVYDLDEESQFMTTFMPGEGQGVMRTDATGETHYAYNADISNKFSGMDSVVTRVNGTTYSYVTTVTMRSKRDGGQAEGVSTSRLSYDVVDGKIRNLEAITTPGGVKNSG